MTIADNKSFIEHEPSMDGMSMYLCASDLAAVMAEDSVMDSPSPGPGSSDQWKELDAWIATVWPCETVPRFERNAITLPLMERIMNDWKQRQLTATDRDHFMALMTEEYTLEADRLDQFWKAGMGATVEDINWSSNSARDAIDDLVALALTLGLKDTKTSSYLCAMTDLRTQLQYQTEQQNRHEMEMERLKQRINESSDTLKMLKQSLQTMDKAWDSQLKAKVHGWKNNSSMLEKKKQEYLIRLEKYKNAYESKKVEQQGLRVGQISDLHRQLAELESRAEEVERELEAYQHLPPDRQLARLAVEAKRSEYMELERERQELLSRMAQAL